MGVAVLKEHVEREREREREREDSVGVE